MTPQLSEEGGREISQILFTAAGHQVVLKAGEEGIELSHPSNRIAAIGIEAGLQIMMDFMKEADAIDVAKFYEHIYKVIARRNN